MSISATKPLVVDLDGTLVNSDMLVENLFLFLRLNPARFMLPVLWLFGGKANFKRKLADAVVPAVNDLPYNEPLLEWLKQRRSEGTPLVLATASDIRIARAVADHLGIFDEVMGTEAHNLSSHKKSAVLVQEYGEGGYAYIGNAQADLAVWRTAHEIHMANPERGVLRAAARLGRIGEVFQTRPAYLPTLVRALRLHQWAKNLLIFVPLLASHRIFEWALVSKGLLAFLVFGMCASSVYMLNDLLDLQDDRKHPSKRHRPLASGAFSILASLHVIPLLVLAAFGLSFWLLPWQFSLVMGVYYLTTMGYSLWFKRVVMLDVVILAVLYTIRVIAGAAAMDLIATFWMLAFSMFVFLSLAFVKRYTELYEVRNFQRTEAGSGRGYLAADFELLASLGGASGYISVLVLALFINDASTGGFYTSPEWMWLACPLLLFWLSRVWLLAHRGDMHHDPVVFALKDGVSRWVGLAFMAVFLLATL